MKLFGLLNLAPPFERRPAGPMLNIGYLYPFPGPIGATVQRMADGHYLDASAWSATEPKPTPMARDAAPKQDRASLGVPADGWAPGDYAVWIHELDPAGDSTRVVGLAPYSIPAPFTEMRVSLGVAGR